MKKWMIAVMGATCAAFTSFGAAKVYVDKATGNDDTGDGTSGSPYATIQKGVTEVDAGGKVYVRPGVYNEGDLTLGASGCSNRVYITKNLTLQATDADWKASTDRRNVVIQGQYDMSDPRGSGWYAGDAAARCIEVASTCTSVDIIGFTLEKGRTKGGSGGDNCNIGGLVLGLAGSSKTRVTDCILRDGAARSGGAVVNVRLIRCFVTECSAWNVGNCMRAASAYNTIFVRNAFHPSSNAVGLFAYAEEAVQCTAVENRCSFFSDNNGNAYNCAIFGSSVGQVAKCNYCVSDDASIAESSTCVVAKYADSVYAPALNDYRLIAGSAGVGICSITGWPMTNNGAGQDIFGNTIKTSGAYNPGAIQATAEAPNYRPLVFDNTFGGADFTVSGLPTGDAKYFGSITNLPYMKSMASYRTHINRAGSATYPACVKVQLPKGGCYGAGNLCVTNSMADIVQIGWDNNVYLPFYKPVNGDELVTNSIKVATMALWVDMNSTAEGTETGAEDHPYRVLQDAVDALVYNSGVIYVKRGDYATGGRIPEASQVNHNCRLAFWRGNSVRVVAVEGPSVTAIVGASDDSDPVNGFGPNAYRCVGAVQGSWDFVNGFTLRGGRVGAVQSDDNADKLVRRGGAAYRAYSTNLGRDKLFLTDCVITDCTGREGAITYNAHLIRCKVYGAGRWNSAPFIDGDIVSSSIWNCGYLSGTPSENLTGVSIRLFNVSAGENKVGSGIGGQQAFNSIIATGCGVDLNGSCSGSGTVKYSLYETSVREDSAYDRTGRFEGLLKGKATFRDGDNGLLQLIATSDGANLASYSVMYTACPIDINGTPFTGDADGRFPAGAYATLARGVTFETDYASGISPSSPRGFDANDQLTVTATAHRPFLGFEIDGATVVPAAHGTNYTLNASEVAGTGTVTIRALYGDTFYVSPTGSNDNSGFYEDTPFLTISNAFAQSLSTDRVIALPGTYGDEQGSQKHSSDATVETRVVVPANRTLESRDGAATTIILGKLSTENKKSMGLGPDAIRGIYLCGGAKITGFTIRDGRTDYQDAADNINTHGGGVCSTSTGSWAIDCVFDNCAATRGGSAWATSLLRCVFKNGKLPHYAGIFANQCNAYRCYFGSSYAQNSGASYFYNGTMFSCTVGADCCTDKTTTPAAANFSNTSGKTGVWVANCIFANGGTVNTENGTNVYNCAFKTGTSVKPCVHPDAPGVFGDTALDENGVPVIGQCVGVDAADETYMSETVKAKDLAGCTRIWNGARDMGAYEADWRAHYAQSLNRRNVTVSEAPESAVEQDDGRIKLIGGELAANWANPNKTQTRYIVKYEVAGNGTLTITLNGSEVVSQTGATAGVQTYEYVNGNENNALTFAYAAGTDDPDGAYIGNLVRKSGSLVIIR